MKYKKQIKLLLLLAVFLLVLPNLTIAACSGTCRDAKYTSSSCESSEQEDLSQGCSGTQVCCIVKKSSSTPGNTSTSSSPSTQYTPMEKIPGTDSATDFPSYVKAIYKFGIWTIGIAAMLMIMIGGFMYITSAGNNATMGKAKGYITDALIGLVMAMTAYLLLNTINPDLVNIKINFPSGSGSGTGTGSGPSAAQLAQNKEECDKYCDAGGDGIKDNATCKSDCMAEKAKQQTKSGGDGNGTCDTISTGPCSVDNLGGTCFGSNASQASSICNAESKGSPTIPSGVDKCADGNSASWGLFQINITVHQVGGLNCPSAFSGGGYTASNHNCKVVNQSLYDQCVAAAKDPANNIAVACKIGNNGAKWGQWGANRNCGFNK